MAQAWTDLGYPRDHEVRARVHDPFHHDPGALLQYLADSRKQTGPVYWTDQDAADHRVRALCRLVLALPEFQLD